MDNQIKIFLLGKETKSLNLSGTANKEISVNLEISSYAPLTVNVISKNDWIEISALTLNLSEKPCAFSVTVTPSEDFTSLSGEVIFEGNDLIEKMEVHVAPAKLPEKQKMQSPAQPKSDEIFKCKTCGKEVPDKRPFCADCRRKMEDDKKSQEDKAEQLQRKADFLKKLPFAIALIVIFSIIVIFASMSKPKKEEGFGNLVINSEPAGALVISLDNKFNDGKTPLTVNNLQTGIYKFSLQMDNCGNQNEIIGIEVKKNETSTYNAKMIMLGNLNIDSLPQGAQILIDDIKTDQKTPAELKNINAGPKKVTLVFEDDLERSENTTVNWGETSELFILKEASLAGVSIKAEEGIKVYADGNLIGLTPLPVFLLKPGKHIISLISPAILTYKNEVQLQGGNVSILTPDLTFLGVLELKAQRPSSLYIDDEYMGKLPQTIYCPIGKKVVAEVVADDGAVWKNGFILKEGELRIITANLPPPPPPPVYEPQYYAPPPPPEPFTDFSGFSITRRFPPSQWQKIEEMKNDIDKDGEAEMILAFKSRDEIGSGGNKIMLFLVKKHSGQFFDVIPLRNPRLGCIGEGELISLDILKSDDVGYREIRYSCGNASKGITETGAFVIYRGKAYSPQWVK